jgi:hypothetical protein
VAVPLISVNLTRGVVKMIEENLTLIQEMFNWFEAGIHSRKEIIDQLSIKTRHDLLDEMATYPYFSTYKRNELQWHLMKLECMLLMGHI